VQKPKSEKKGFRIIHAIPYIAIIVIKKYGYGIDTSKSKNGSGIKTKNIKKHKKINI
jgi:hypothetical protein